MNSCDSFDHKQNIMTVLAGFISRETYQPIGCLFLWQPFFSHPAMSPSFTTSFHTLFFEEIL